MKIKIFAIAVILLSGMASVQAGTVSQDTIIVQEVVIVDSIFKNVINKLVHAPCRKSFCGVRFHSLRFSRSNFSDDYFVSVDSYSVADYHPYHLEKSDFRYYVRIGRYVYYLTDDIPWNTFRLTGGSMVFEPEEDIPFTGAAHYQWVYYVPFKEARILINGMYGE